MGSGTTGENGRMKRWKRVDALLRHTRTFTVVGRLRSGDYRSPETVFHVEVPTHGGMPIRLEGILTEAVWDRLRHPLVDRRLAFVARNGPTKMESDDVVPNGSRVDTKRRVSFSLILNSLRESTTIRAKEPGAWASATFGHVPFIEPTYDTRSEVLRSKAVRVQAAGWRVASSAKLDWPEGAPDVDGLILPARVDVSYRRDSLRPESHKDRERALQEITALADDTSSLFSFLSLRRTPWRHVDLVSVARERGHHTRVYAPAITASARPRAALVSSPRAAISSGLRTLLRLRARHPYVAQRLREALFLFAHGWEERDLYSSWYALAQCLDVLGRLEPIRSQRTSEGRRTIARSDLELDEVIRRATQSGMSELTLMALRNTRTDLHRVTYREGITSLMTRNRIDADDIGGPDLVADIVEIRNGLMHQGDLGDEQVRRLQKRSRRRGLGFDATGLPTPRVASQLMGERRSEALLLTARILLRVLRIPDEAARRAWAGDAALLFV